MTRITAIIQPFMLHKVCETLRDMEDLPGLMVSDVLAWGKGRAGDRSTTVLECGCTFVTKKKIEIVIPSAMTDRVVEAIANAAHTGHVGDGKIFVHDLCDVVKICTGEHGEKAI